MVFECNSLLLRTMSKDTNELDDSGCVVVDIEHAATIREIATVCPLLQECQSDIT